jgi:hypothetical protein
MDRRNIEEGSLNKKSINAGGFEKKICKLHTHFSVD